MPCCASLLLLMCVLRSCGGVVRRASAGPATSRVPYGAASGDRHGVPRWSVRGDAHGPGGAGDDLGGLLDAVGVEVLHLGLGDLADLVGGQVRHLGLVRLDRKSTRLNSSHPSISYAVFCLKK